MFDFFGTHKNKSQLTLAVDIGSREVSACIFKEGVGGELPIIFYSVREPIVFQQKLSSENLLAGMLRSLDLCLVHVEKYGLKRLEESGAGKFVVSNATLTLSSPWHSSESKLLNFTQKNSSVVSKSLIDELIDSEEKTFEKNQDKINNRYADFSIVERKIFNIHLDGYPIHSPYGLKAREVEILMFTSVSPKVLLEKVKSLIFKRFSINGVSTHSLIMVACATIRDNFPEEEDFIIVDVGGEVTDVAVIKKGVISHIGTVSVGQSVLERNLLKICAGEPYCSAESLISLHIKGEAGTTESKKVEMAIDQGKMDWLEAFNTTISNFAEVTFLPSRVFLFCDSHYSVFFEKFLRGAELSQFSLTGEGFMPSHVGVMMARKFAEHEKKVVPIVNLAVLANFHSRFSNTEGGVI